MTDDYRDLRTPRPLPRMADYGEKWMRCFRCDGLEVMWLDANGIGWHLGCAQLARVPGVPGMLPPAGGGHDGA